VVINVPLTSKTRGLFNEQTIGKMKKGAVLASLFFPFPSFAFPNICCLGQEHYVSWRTVALCTKPCCGCI